MLEEIEYAEELAGGIDYIDDCAWGALGVA